jgi:hypothetical protein
MAMTAWLLTSLGKYVKKQFADFAASILRKEHKTKSDGQ